MIRGVFNHESDDFQNWALNSPGWWRVSLFKYGVINFYRKSSSPFWWGHSSALAVLLHRISIGFLAVDAGGETPKWGVMGWSGIPRSDWVLIMCLMNLLFYKFYCPSMSHPPTIKYPPNERDETVGLLDPWMRAHFWGYRIWSRNEIDANAALVASRMLCLSPGSGRSFLHFEKGGVPVNMSLTINIRWWSNENHTIHRGGANW